MVLIVIWLLLSNSKATSLIWSAHSVSLACCDHPHRSFCQFRRTTWTLLLVVSLLLLRDFGTPFHWTVELLHLLTHLRSILRHFSCTCLCTMARYKFIDWFKKAILESNSSSHYLSVSFTTQAQYSSLSRFSYVRGSEVPRTDTTSSRTFCCTSGCFASISRHQLIATAVVWDRQFIPYSIQLANLCFSAVTSPDISWF